MQKPFVLLTLAILSLVTTDVAAQEKKPLLDLYGDSLPEGAIARLGTVRFRSVNNVSSIAYSPTGKFLATLDSVSGTISFWDAKSGKLLNHKGSNTFSTGLAFSRDGKKLLAGGTLVNPNNGEQIRVMSLDRFPTTALSPDGKIIASASRERDKPSEIEIWNAANGKAIHRLSGHTDGITALAFSPKEAAILASAGHDRVIRVWNAEGGKPIWTSEEHGGSVSSVAVAPDGKTMASGCEDGFVRLWDTSSGKLAKKFRPHPAQDTFATYSPDGKLLAVTGQDDSISLWNSKSGKLLRQWHTGSQPIHSLSFAPDGSSIATAESFRSIRIWSTETGKELLPIKGHRSVVQQIRFAPDGKTLTAWGGDRRLVQWNLTTAEPTANWPDQTWGITSDETWASADLSPDAKVLAIVRRTFLPGNKIDVERPVRLLDGRSNKEIQALVGHEKLVVSVRFSANGDFLASNGHDGVRVWKTATGKEVSHIRDARTLFFDFSKDGKHLTYFNIKERRIYQWDVENGRVIKAWNSGVDRVGALISSPDGKLIAGHVPGESVIVWVVGTGMPLWRRFADTAVFSSPIFSPTGRMVAITDRARGDNTNDIFLLETRTGQIARKIPAPQGWVRALAFSPNGQSLASAGDDTTILLWDLTGHHNSPPKAIDAQELDRLWDDLALDAARADRGHWTLALASKQSLPFLKTRLQPRPRVAAGVIDALMADLDSKTLEDRKKAEQTLVELGESAEAALRARLARDPSIELRRRIEHILDKRGPEVLRQLRAIDVLEQIGGADARDFLGVLAKGSPNPRVVEAAEAAGRRLAK